MTTVHGRAAARKAVKEVRRSPLPPLPQPPRGISLLIGAQYQAHIPTCLPRKNTVTAAHFIEFADVEAVFKSAIELSIEQSLSTSGGSSIHDLRENRQFPEVISRTKQPMTKISERWIFCTRV